MPIVAARAVSRKARSLVASARTLSRINSKTRSRSGNSDRKEGGVDSAAPTGPQTKRDAQVPHPARGPIPAKGDVVRQVETNLPVELGGHP